MSLSNLISTQSPVDFPPLDPILPPTPPKYLVASSAVSTAIGALGLCPNFFIVASSPILSTLVNQLSTATFCLPAFFITSLLTSALRAKFDNLVVPVITVFKPSLDFPTNFSNKSLLLKILPSGKDTELGNSTFFILAKFP